jgi:predicted adenylyl cyclase CyaB
MARNVEIKAWLPQRETCIIRAEQMSGRPAEVIHQEDIFFPCESGRLKLRIFSRTGGELIFYRRTDEKGPKTSDYSITKTEEPIKLREIMEKAFGIRAVVKKTRLLFLVGRTRIHIDAVEDLGDFIELEVVLDDSEDKSVCEKEIITLMQELGIDETNLIDSAYVDLIEKAGG